MLPKKSFQGLVVLLQVTSNPCRKQPGPMPKGYQMLTFPQVLGQCARLAAEGGRAPDATNMMVDVMLHINTSCMVVIAIPFAEPMR